MTYAVAVFFRLSNGLTFITSYHEFLPKFVENLEYDFDLSRISCRQICTNSKMKTKFLIFIFLEIRQQTADGGQRTTAAQVDQIICV